MSSDASERSDIRFTFAYASHGWATASVSDGKTTYSMDPSYVPNDPLLDLIHALVEVLTYGGEAACMWNYEPAADQWLLHRDGEVLHVTIRGSNNGFYSWPNLPHVRVSVRFTATCSVWKFAAQVRVAASRFSDTDVRDHWHGRIGETGEYKTLCALLDEHKRISAPTNEPDGAVK